MKVAGFFSLYSSSEVGAYKNWYDVEWDPFPEAATDAARVAITQLFKQSPADAEPSAKLIGKTAHRFALLGAQLSVLKQVDRDNIVLRAT